MDLLEKWYRNLLSNSTSRWKYSLTARGECRRHTGPSIWYAAVNIAIAPGDQLEIEDKLDPKQKEYISTLGWYDQIIFGVLDVMLTCSITPIRRFKLTILDIDFNEIESNSWAFRLAAREATQKIINLGTTSQ